MKASPVAAPRRFHAATKADAVKHHAPVDSAAILLAAVLTAANMQDRSAFPMMLRQAKQIAPSSAHI